MARINSDRLVHAGPEQRHREPRRRAGGSVGAKPVASADPDGYTILMTPQGSLDNWPGGAQKYRLRPVQGIHANRQAHRDAAIHLRPSASAGDIAGRGRGLRKSQSGKDRRPPFQHPLELWLSFFQKRPHSFLLVAGIEEQLKGFRSSARAVSRGTSCPSRMTSLMASTARGGILRMVSASSNARGERRHHPAPLRTACPSTEPRPP